MTTQEFFTLQLGVTFTASELHDIMDALHVTSEYYDKIGLNSTARSYKLLRKKIHEYIKNNVNIKY